MDEAKSISAPYKFSAWCVFRICYILLFPTYLIIYQMGCYQEGIAKDSVGGKDVTAHIFECVDLA